MLSLKQCWSFSFNHAVCSGVKRNMLIPESVRVEADAGHRDTPHCPLIKQTDRM